MYGKSRGGPTGGVSGGCAVSFLLDECLEPGCRRIPLRGHVIEICPGLFQSLRVEIPDLLATPACVPHQAGRAELVEMPGNRLARDTAPFGEARDRERSLRRQPPQQPKPCRIPQCGEH